MWLERRISNNQQTHRWRINKDFKFRNMVQRYIWMQPFYNYGGPKVHKSAPTEVVKPQKYSSKNGCAWRSQHPNQLSQCQPPPQKKKHPLKMPLVEDMRICKHQDKNSIQLSRKRKCEAIQAKPSENMWEIHLSERGMTDAYTSSAPEAHDTKFIQHLT